MKPLRTIEEGIDLAVAGAGPMGLAAALAALGAGLRVAVFERSAGLQAGAAWWSGGMLAPECEAENSSPAVVELGRRALQLWPAMPGNPRFSGTLVVAPARDPSGLARFARVTRNHRRLDGAGIADLEPDLAGRFDSGLFFPEEGHLDPRRTLSALAEAVMDRGGVIRFGWTGEIGELKAAKVLDARGLGARDRLPIVRGVKGEIVLVRCPELTFSRPIRLLHQRHPLYVVPRADHVFMIGATSIESEDCRVSLRSAGELLTQAYALHPAFADAEVLEFGAGLRPALPDNEPRLSVEGRFVTVNGLYRHGWMLAPALAEKLMDMIGGEIALAAEAER